jgi:hypothetical protein
LNLKPLSHAEIGLEGGSFNSRKIFFVREGQTVEKWNGSKLKSFFFSAKRSTAYICSSGAEIKQILILIATDFVSQLF